MSASAHLKMALEFRHDDPADPDSVAVFTDGSLMGVYESAVFACHALFDSNGNTVGSWVFA